MESNNTNHHINLSVNYLTNIKCDDLYFENMNESISILLKQLFSGDVDVGGNKELSEVERMEIFNQVSAVMQ